jgi:hypothetical protein
MLDTRLWIVQEAAVGSFFPFSSFPGPVEDGLAGVTDGIGFVFSFGCFQQRAKARKQQFAAWLWSFILGMEWALPFSSGLA